MGDVWGGVMPSAKPGQDKEPLRAHRGGGVPGVLRFRVAGACHQPPARPHRPVPRGPGTLRAVLPAAPSPPRRQTELPLMLEPPYLLPAAAEGASTMGRLCALAGADPAAPRLKYKQVRQHSPPQHRCPGGEGAGPAATTTRGNTPSPALAVPRT